MGALGLEDWGRRPRGKGCLLLAVAGTTSLVTLLLAVPITVLAVLAVVPQKQGGPVSGPNKDPEGCCSCSLISGYARGLLRHLLSWLGSALSGRDVWFSSVLALSMFLGCCCILLSPSPSWLSLCLLPLPKKYLGLSLPVQVHLP